MRLNNDRPFSQCLKRLAKSLRGDRRVKLSFLMYWTGLDAAAGEQQLANCQGNLRQAIQSSL